jgi:hypothetical protein
MDVSEAHRRDPMDGMKVGKNKKSPTKRANQQQEREKNDFSAWKVPLSPLASH